MPSIEELVKETKHQLKTLRGLIYRKTYEIGAGPEKDKAVINNFHKLYYDSAIFNGTWTKTSWLGVPVLKCPLDLWIYQELLYRLKPDRIVECGTAAGGGSLFFASMCDLLNHGKVLSIDIEWREGRPQHPRLEYFAGSSTSNEAIRKVENFLVGAKSVLIILDSDHSKKHVLDELKMYCKFVSKGDYLVVEDSNINGHPVYSQFGPGPMEAIEEFLKENNDFEVDVDKEKFLLTFNPNGYLKKVR